MSEVQGYAEGVARLEQEARRLLVRIAEVQDFLSGCRLPPAALATDDALQTLKFAVSLAGAAPAPDGSSVMAVWRWPIVRAALDAALVEDFRRLAEAFEKLAPSGTARSSIGGLGRTSPVSESPPML